MQISADQLKQIMPRLERGRLVLYLEPLNLAMTEFEINTPARAAAFLAQVAHETGELRWLDEIWGPTPAQSAYEDRHDLGNTQEGDGRRFKGRGALQITGRANYQIYGEALGVDLVSHPETASAPALAFRIAGCFWKTHDLNKLADAGAIESITRKINGGLNGLQDRRKYWIRARMVLG